MPSTGLVEWQHEDTGRTTEMPIGEDPGRRWFRIKTNAKGPETEKQPPLKFFSYDPDDDFVLHKTRDDAEGAAESALALFRDDAKRDGYWDEEVNRIHWGQIQVLGEVVEVERRPPRPNEDVSGDCDEIVDYGLRNSEGTESVVITS